MPRNMRGDPKEPRASHLANLFLAGIENIYFANDTCGKPLNEEDFLIWKFFSGSFFQHSYENYQLNNQNYLKELYKNRSAEMVI